MSKYKLVLEEIGKFKNCNFDLNDVTIFHGPNEAGKTTIIDALIYCLATSRKNQYLYSQILEPRYGNKINCRLKLNSNNEDVNKIDHDLVKNLLVVRASSLELEFTNKSAEATWVEDVRNKLFTGGVNPQKIVDSINLMEKKTKGSGSPLFEHKKLEEEISILKSQLQHKITQIQGQASIIKKQEELTHREVELSQQAANLTEEVRVKSEKRIRFKKLSERSDVTNQQAKLSEKLALTEKLAKSSSYSEENYNKIKEQEDALKNLEQKRELQKAELGRKAQAVQSAEDELKNFQHSLEKSQQHHELARRTQIRLEEMVSFNEAKKGKGPFIIALAILIIGVALLMTLPTPFNYLGLLLIAGAAGLLWKTSLVDKTQETNTIDLKSEIRFFNQQYKTQPSCPDTSYALAMDFLHEIVESFVTSSNKLEQLKKNVANSQAEVDLINQNLFSLEKQIIEAGANLNGLLPIGLKKSEEFYKLVQERVSDSNRFKALEEELKRAMSKLGLGSLDDLSQYLSHKIIEMNNDHIAHEEFTQRDLSLLEQEIVELTNQKEELASQVGHVGKELTGTNKEIQLTLNQLSVDHVRLQKLLLEKEEARDKKLLEMDSMRLLKSMVAEIAEDATEKFSALSDGINKYLSIILDKKRDIKFSNLTNLEDIQYVDYYGNAREAQQLSSGTKDAFVLSARLALLEKVNLPKDAFLILDDPFVLMDNERQDKAIKALKKFYDDAKIPLVVFTKDDGLRERVKAEFAEAHSIELTR